MEAKCVLKDNSDRAQLTRKEIQRFVRSKITMSYVQEEVMDNDKNICISIRPTEEITLDLEPNRPCSVLLLSKVMLQYNYPHL